MKKNIYYFFLGIIIFLFLYVPSLKILFTKTEFYFYIFSLIIFIFDFPCKSFFSIKGIKTLFFLFLFPLLYSIIISCIFPVTNVSFQSIFFVSNMRTIIDVFVVSYFLIMFIKWGNVSKEHFDKLLLYVAIIQAWISFFMIINPNFKHYIFYDLLKLSKNNKMTNPGIYLQRGFGIAANYLMPMPVFQAFMGCLYWLKSKKKNLIFSINFLFLLLSAVLNARTSIVIFGIFFLYLIYKEFENIFFHNVIKLKTVLFFLFIVSCIIFLIIYFINFLLTNEYFKFFMRIFDGTYDITGILRSMIFFPETALGLLFGNGEYIFTGGTFGRNSDIGYINDIWFGGIFYCLLWIGIFLFLFLCIRKYYPKSEEKTMLMLLFIALPIIHYKGNIITPSEFLKIISLLFYSNFLLHRDMQNVEEKKKLCFNASIKKLIKIYY